MTVPWRLMLVLPLGVRGGGGEHDVGRVHLVHLGALHRGLQRVRGHGGGFIASRVGHLDRRQHLSEEKSGELDHDCQIV